MKVQGMVNPDSFTVEEIPGTKRSLVRLYQNVEACKIAKDSEDKEGLDGFQYDEYCVEVESWPGLAASVRENYDTYLAKGKDNEVDRSNDALFRAQKNTDSIVQDTDAMSVDLPALGKPMTPTSARSFRSSRSDADSPGSPSSACLGAWFVEEANDALPRPPLPPFATTTVCP